MEPTSPKIWLEIGHLYLNGFQVPTIAVKAYGRAKELATFMQRREDALRAVRGVRVRVRGTDEIRRRCRRDGDARERRHRPWRCVHRVRPSELGASRIRTSSRNRSRANSKDENYDLGRRRLATRLPKAQGAYETPKSRAVFADPRCFQRRNRRRRGPRRLKRCLPNARADQRQRSSRRGTNTRRSLAKSPAERRRANASAHRWTC